MKLLTHTGIDRKIVGVIKQLYEDNMAKFTLGSVSMGWTTNNIGVRQGCVMSPTLFIFYLEKLTVRIRKSGKGDRKLGCLAYADDTVFMAENKTDRQASGSRCMEGSGI